MSTHTQNDVPVENVPACSFCERTVDEVMFLAHNEKAAVCDGCAVTMVGQAIQQSYSNALLLRDMSNEVIRLKEEQRVTIATDKDVERIISEQNA